MAICEIKFCQTEGYLRFYGHEVCGKHWGNHCSDADKLDLKIEFGIPVLTLDQGKVFLDCGDDLVLCTDAGPVVLKAVDYDEDTFDKSFKELTENVKWVLKKYRGIK